jgi:predicted negative regulator of RcsB-dependent stress response
MAGTAAAQKNSTNTDQYQQEIRSHPKSSLAHFRLAEILFEQGELVASVNEFKNVLNGDLQPKWTTVWARINLGKIFDATGQRARAMNEYRLAAATHDNTREAQIEIANYLDHPFQRK